MVGDVCILGEAYSVDPPGPAMFDFMRFSLFIFVLVYLVHLPALISLSYCILVIP